MKSVVVQVCDVHRGLLSVRKITRSGNRVVFDNEGSYIENKSTGEVTRLNDDGGMYELTMWVKRKDFLTGKAGWRGSTSGSVDRDGRR